MNKFLITILLAVLTAPALAEEKPVRRWGARDLTPSVLSRVYRGLAPEDRDRLKDLPIEEVLEYLEKQRKSSPYRTPWTRKDLAKENNGEALLDIFKEKKPDVQKRMMQEIPFIDAVNQLKRSVDETAGASIPTMTIRAEEPEVRNAGTAKARISLRGTTTGVEDKTRVRVAAELRYPNRDSLPVLANGRVMVNGNKFKLDLKLPRKQLLLGKYWVRVKLDFAKVRDKTSLMRDGELPTVTASRACYVGIDEEFRNSPATAPSVLRQDIAIKVWHLALIEYQPIQIGSAEYPAESADALFWDTIGRDLQTQRAAQRAAGAIPALELRDTISARADEMGEYFDPALWQEFLDTQVYPAIEASEKLIRERRQAVLQERFPEYYQHFLSRAGILRMLQEYAALRSRELYTAAGQELPAADKKRIRSRGRKPQDCLNLIQHELNHIYNRKRGVSVAAITDLHRALAEFGR